MTRRERAYMRRLRDMLNDRTRPAAEARRLAAVQVGLMLKIDRTRRQMQALVREGAEAARRAREAG